MPPESSAESNWSAGGWGLVAGVLAAAGFTLLGIVSELSPLTVLCRASLGGAFVAAGVFGAPLFIRALVASDTDASD